MWGNISKHVGAAIQQVQKLQSELESQLDAAVGADDGVKPLPPSKNLFDQFHLNEIPPVGKDINTATGSDAISGDTAESSLSLPILLYLDPAVESDEKMKNIAEGNGLPNNSIISSIVVKDGTPTKKSASDDVALKHVKEGGDVGWHFDDHVFETRELKCVPRIDLLSEVGLTEGQTDNEAQKSIRDTALPNGRALDGQHSTQGDSIESAGKNVTPYSALSDVTNGMSKSSVTSATKTKKKKRIVGDLSKCKIESTDISGTSAAAETETATATSDPVSSASSAGLASPLTLTSIILPLRPLNSFSEGIKGLLHSVNGKEPIAASTSSNAHYDDDKDDDAVTMAAPSTAIVSLSTTTQPNDSKKEDGYDADTVVATTQQHEGDDDDGGDAATVVATTQQHDGDGEDGYGADTVVATTQQHEGDGDDGGDAAAVIATTQQHEGDCDDGGDNGGDRGFAIKSGHDFKDLQQSCTAQDDDTNDVATSFFDTDESPSKSQTASLLLDSDLTKSSTSTVQERLQNIIGQCDPLTGTGTNVNGVSYEKNMSDIENMHLLAMETLRASYEERNQQMITENEAASMASKIIAEADIREQALKYNAENTALSTLVSELEESLLEARRELRRTLTAVSEKDTRFAKATEDSSKLVELVTERERALEASALKMAETHMQLEAAQRKIIDLSNEVSEKDSKLRQSQVTATGEVELRKQLQRAQELMKEKEGRLAAFEQEGQNLSKKQSEMEKIVRTTKADVKKRDTEIAKLKESKEQLVKAIEEMQDLVRKNELEASNAIKSLSAMQAVSQASTDKLSRLEGDIVSKSEELGSQRRAMEAAWADSNETKRLVAELRADRDDLRRQIGLGTSKVMETESSRRDIEQREAVLRATNKQLQDSLQRQMQESGLREERLRDEVGEMRKRWQDAVTSRETLSSELGSATAPLMRQIASMQDTVRTKSEVWQVIEASLSERALRAESVAEIADQKKIAAEELVMEQKMKISILSTKLEDSILACQAAESALEKAVQLEASACARSTELESLLALEQGRMQSLQSSLRELELRHIIDQQDAKDAVDFISKQGEGILSRVVAESEALREELQAERGNGGKKMRLSSQQNLSQNRLSAPGSSSSSGKSNRLKSHDYIASSEATDCSNTAHDGDDSTKIYSNRGYSASTMQDATLPSKYYLS